MRDQHLRKKTYHLLNIIICIAMVAQSTPLLAMSYEKSAYIQQQQVKPIVPPTAVSPPDTPDLHPAPRPEMQTSAPAAAGKSPLPKSKLLVPSQQTPPSLDQIPLVPHWNLISTPKEPSTTDASVVLNPLAGDYNVAYAYDGCQTADPWHVFDPDAPPATNDLTTIDHTIGLWVQATSDTTLALDGTVPPSTTIPLCTGWNLIGMPAAQARPVRNALFSIDGHYSRVFGYDPTDGEDPWAVYDVTAPEWANDLQIMHPGQGYWILATADVTLTIANEGKPPIAHLISPQENNPEIIPITFITDVIGTAYSDILAKWTLSYRPQGESTWTAFATGTTPVLTDTLDQFDPTLLLNGLYEIELAVQDYEGIIALAYSHVVIDGAAKIGHFTLTFVDLEIPLAGFPIRVIRTYDSRDKRNGDFGIGWTLGIDNIQLEESAPPGDGWLSALGAVSENPILPFFEYCLPPELAHVVTITFPDNTVYNFRPTISPECQLLIPHTIIDIAYEPLPGTQGTLESVDQSSQNLLVVGGNPAPPLDFGDGPLGSFDPVPNQFWNQDIIALHDPSVYKLTLPDGTQFIISQTDGVQSITDASGNVLTVNDNGITHSSGKGVSFERDDLGRISQITDPLSNTLQYAYDANGDLMSVTAPDESASTYTYVDDHYLTTYFYPDGTLGMRNEYDDNGRLLSTTNSSGGTVNLGHDLNTRQEIITSIDGTVTVTEYDQRGNITRLIDALGNVITHTYDANDNQISTTNALGHTIQRTFDAQNNLLSETNSLGYTTTFTYDDSNRLLTTTDANNNTIVNTYNANGDLLTETNALGIDIRRFQYDQNGNLLTITDPLSHTATFEYDTFGNITKLIDARGGTETYQYDANNNIVSTTDARGSTVTTINDSHGRFIQKTDPFGNTMEADYDTRGELVSITGVDGKSMERVVDGNGNEIISTDALGHITLQQFNAQNELIRRTDAAGFAVTFAYDPLGRLVKETFPDDSFTQKVYDAAGQIIQEIDTNGNAWGYEYDGAGQITKITDPLNQPFQLDYDPVGNLITETDALSNTFSFVYDKANQLIQEGFPDGASITYQYDEAGNNTHITNELGQTTQLEFNADGQPTKVYDPLGYATAFTYDPGGNLLTQTDANAHTTSYEYDINGRLVKRTYPDGTFASLVYNTFGNPIAQTDPNGNTLQYEYDAMYHLTTKAFPDSTQVQYAYTPLGGIETITDTRGVTSYTYDNRDRLIQIDYPDTSRIHYTYDSAGNRTAVTTQTSLTATPQTTTYTYDALNRLLTVTDHAGQVTTYEYDAIGNRSRINYPNGTYTQYTYDSRSRLTAMEHGLGTTILARYTYTLNAAGDRTRVDQLDGSYVTYEYDARRFLTRETYKNSVGSTIREWTYTYDNVGNRLTKTDTVLGTTISYAYDDNDRLLSAGDTTYTYDNNGNVLSKTNPGGTTTYNYDFENRLTGVLAPGGITTTYRYDDQGNRVQKLDADGVVNYLVDPNNNTGLAQVLVEYDETGAQLTAYTYGDDLISQEQAGFFAFYYYDAAHNTRLLADIMGNVTDQYDFDTFGALLSATGTTENNYLFNGEQFDPQSGFYYLRARYYDPTIGRFISRDPLRGSSQDPASLHKYLYAMNNPTTYADPSGESSILQTLLVSFAISATISAIIDYIGGKSPGEIVANALISGALGALTAGVGGTAAASIFTRKFGEWLVKHGLVRVAIPLLKALISTASYWLTSKPRPSAESTALVFGGNFIIELIPFARSADGAIAAAQKKFLGDKVSKLGGLNIFQYVSRHGLDGLNELGISTWKYKKVLSSSYDRINNELRIFTGGTLTKAGDVLVEMISNAGSSLTSFFSSLYGEEKPEP